MDGTKDFRQCLGKFTTGVTVVTCCDSEGRSCGITANSFSSVSLEPPLVLWNIAKVSNSLDAYLEATHFAINILSESQVDISKHFARPDHTRFNGIAHSVSGDNAPLASGYSWAPRMQDGADSRGRRPLHHHRRGRRVCLDRPGTAGIFWRRLYVASTSTPDRSKVKSRGVSRSCTDVDS